MTKKKPKSRRPAAKVESRAKSTRASTERFRATAAGRITDPSREQLEGELARYGAMALILVRAKDELNRLGSPLLVAPLRDALTAMADAISRGDASSIEAEGGPAYWARARLNRPLNRAHAGYAFVALVERNLEAISEHVPEPRHRAPFVAALLADRRGAHHLVWNCWRYLDLVGVDYGLCPPIDGGVQEQMITEVQRAAGRQLNASDLDAYQYAVALLVGAGVERAKAHDTLRPAREGDRGDELKYWRANTEI